MKCFLVTVIREKISATGKYFFRNSEADASEFLKILKMTPKDTTLIVMYVAGLNL